MVPAAMRGTARGAGVRPSKSERAVTLLDRPLPSRLLRRAPVWSGTLVLNYHRVGDPTDAPWDRTLWSATAEGFDEQLALLALEADVVGPAELPEATARGRHVMVTFDDGYRDNYEIAFPLLRRHNLTATFFLASGFLDAPRPAWWDEIAWMVRNATAATVAPGEWLAGEVPLSDPEPAIAALVRAYKALPATRGERYLDHLAAETGSGRCPAEAVRELWMTWEMARELSAAGMTLGGHTVTHPLLARLGERAQAAELDGCAERLCEELNQPMRWFAYPVGSRDAFDATTKRLLRQRGVELAFSFYGGVARARRWDPLDVPRLHVGPRVDRARLAATLRLPQLFARAD